MPDLVFNTLSEQPETEPDLEYTLDPDKPLVLLLGWVDHEGILSTLKASGQQYKKKLLSSRPENWTTIAALFDEFKISSVLGKFPGEVMSLLVEPLYAEVRQQLFKRVGEVPNQIYVYEKVLQGEQTEGIRAEINPYPSQDVRDSSIEFLRSNNIEIVPYKTKAEVTVLAASFLDELDRNLILRLYIPSGRLWSSEADKFLQLFQDYIAKVDRLAVRLDQKRTDYGVIYEFHGEAPPGESNLSTEFQEFSKLMDLCVTDSEAAASLLTSKNLDIREVTRILERYSKEVRRLQLDIKHDAESKIISIRHRLESELIEFNPTEEDCKAIDSMVNAVVPSFSSGLPLPSQSMSSLSLQSRPTAANVTYNFRPQFINTLNGVIAEEIHGNQHFSPEYHQLLEVVREHGGTQKRQLETAVYEIADKGVDRVDKLQAKQRLKSFLMAAGKKTGDMAFSILQKYIESQIGV
jgi:hypothetical protein